MTSHDNDIIHIYYTNSISFLFERVGSLELEGVDTSEFGVDKPEGVAIPSTSRKPFSDNLLMENYKTIRHRNSDIHQPIHQQVT